MSPAEILTNILRDVHKSSGTPMDASSDLALAGSVWQAPDGSAASVSITVEGKTYVLEVAEA